MALASAAGSMQEVLGVDIDEPSAWPRARTTASAVAMNVFAGTMTSSPGPMPAARRCQLEGVGAVGHADAVADAAPRREGVLELADLGALDERCALEDLVEAAPHLIGDGVSLDAQINQGNFDHDQLPSVPGATERAASR